jgi:RIO kinase 1
MFRNLQNDASYRESRMRGKDRRSAKAMDSKSQRGRSFRIESWIQFEFETQRRLFDAGVCVPQPVDCHGSAILMELIGDAEQAAPRLCDVDLDPSEAPLQFESLIRNIELMLTCDRIHADLSPYNVLYWQGTSVIIDLAQAVDARSGSDVLPFLLRDVDRLARHFVRLGVKADPESVALEMWAKYTRGALARLSPGDPGSGDLR